MRQDTLLIAGDTLLKEALNNYLRCQGGGDPTTERSIRQRLYTLDEDATPSNRTWYRHTAN
ncbi:hypothetical protein [Pseudomonas sp. C27(2019)]|uniref:hypothetical protein n=1 Tax=Pseudomonas sp. C27(2019) TaxID=2604941 RepID=UPI003531B7AE